MCAVSFGKFRAVSAGTMLISGMLVAGQGFCGQAVSNPTVAPNTREVPVISDTAEKKIIEHMQESNLGRLTGWPGMIFYCPGDSANSEALKKICETTYANLEALANEHGVKFHKARNANDMAVLPHLTGRLKVLIELDDTNPAVSPAAIAGRVTVLAHYTGAVNRYTDLAQDPSQVKHPLSVPQHVDAILWQASTVKAGATLDDAVRPVSDAINEKLHSFFDTYEKANK